ncbi:Flp pilus assembly protein CpaB [Salipiger sp. IMCC34102]|uniref:Flp pilus assembly protein CpaB n=1 Tax=Salipiger sp. IMCC34102 TaxID=2510647 RepID=UPI00101BAAEF|nr:Flp pilus assembly protein CpaB [Salipiger sp. IMCC34102]RYH01137.1 Flp pilus assembly protein CpaB [Salipiger sp. IMCC34102]
MRTIFGLVLILGIGMAGFAVFMVKDYMSAQQAQLQIERERAAQVVEVVEVIAAANPMTFGDSLRPEDVTTVVHTKEFLPEGAFATMEDLFPEGENITRSMIRPVEPNEVILLSDVTAPGEIATIAQQLDPRMRAFTFRVDVSTGVSGFLRPGDFVDVYWTGSVSGRGGGDQTYLIGSSIPLIAVDQSTDRNLATTQVPSTVTVQVSPDDVARLAQVKSEGGLSLALVGRDSNVDPVPAGEQAIFLPEPPVEVAEAPVVEAPAPEPAAPERCYTTVRRGTQAVQTEIACSN